MNSLIIDKRSLELARKQFCLDIGLPWEEYLQNPRQQVYIQKAVYREGTLLNRRSGARNYEGRNDFFHAIICLGQLFLVVDEQIYDWAVEKFRDCSPEWFCEFGNLRMIDEKLKEFGHRIRDTHVYFLPESACGAEIVRKAEGACRAEGVRESESACGAEAARESECECGAEIVRKSERTCGAENTQMPAVVRADSVKAELAGWAFWWYNQEELLRFKENNCFTSAICFSQTQPDMMAVAAVKCGDQAACEAAKPFDQSRLSGMAGVSADGQYLWQIGINVRPEATGKGLANQLVRMLKDRVLETGKIPFYGTCEAHTISQTVGLKAGFVPAWTEVYVE